jgi:hypothetical protein
MAKRWLCKWIQLISHYFAYDVFQNRVVQGREAGEQWRQRYHAARQAHQLEVGQRNEGDQAVFAILQSRLGSGNGRGLRLEMLIN